jgi:hypothetical protein
MLLVEFRKLIEICKVRTSALWKLLATGITGMCVCRNDSGS